MSSVKPVCPQCGAGEGWLVFLESRWVFDNGGTWGWREKPYDPDAPARCLRCGWDGERADTENTDGGAT